MEEKDLREIVFAKDTVQALAKFRNLELLCDCSAEFYPYFDLYRDALHSDNSCVRARGFKLLLKNAKWDTENHLNEHLTEILAVLDDEKSTVVRQCLPMLLCMAEYKKELIPEIIGKLNGLNDLKYKESMRGLIKKDIDSVLRVLQR